MGYTIRERADVVATYRYVSVALMEMLARWVPTSPELEAKCLFGRHIWDLAQHADQFGRRTSELRLALHTNRQPIAPFVETLTTVGNRETTTDRIAAFYDVVLPDLASRYRSYLADTDALLDEPTVRLLERMLTDFDRMRGERNELLEVRPDLAGGDTSWREELAVTVASHADFVDYRPAAAPEGVG